MTKTLKKPLVSLIIIFVISLVADQVTKQWAINNLVDEGFHQRTDDYPVCGDPKEELKRRRFISVHREDQTVIQNFFDFHYVENCASAFGVMSKVPESFRFPFFLLISALACFFIPYLYIKTEAEHKLMLYALPFILGGALGNLLDRLIYRFVIDFIDWYVIIGGEEHHWPTFNIADAAIVIGIGLMILQMLPQRNTANESKKENKGTAEKALESSTEPTENTTK